MRAMQRSRLSQQRRHRWQLQLVRVIQRRLSPGVRLAEISSRQMPPMAHGNELLARTNEE